MADIFISYSKADRDLARKLSVALESEGWTVWWDRSLKAGDEYRPEISIELAKARVAIVIWSDTSIHSEWVRAEASRAKADGKLIPVKAINISYADIPLPFGELHTENINEWQLINAAVVARLATPAVKASFLRMASKAANVQFLAWFGIVGAAISLFTSARELLNLADWARWIVTNWSAWTEFVWTALATWLGIYYDIPRQIIPLLTFIAFTAMLVVGLRLSDVRWSRSEKIFASRPHHIRRRFIVSAALALPSASFLVWSILYKISFIETPLPISSTQGSVLGALIIILGLIFTSDQKRECAIAMSLYTLLASVALYLPLHGMLDDANTDRAAAEEGINERPNLSDASTYRRSWDEGVLLEKIIDVSIPTFLLALLLVVILSRPQTLLRRLSFIAIGFASLLLLNEISLLKLHKYLIPPTQASAESLIDCRYFKA
jgi:hypothetical protein